MATTTTTGLVENGILKKVVEYKFDEEYKYEIITTTRIVERRRPQPKSVDIVCDNVVVSRPTTNQEILLERPRAVANGTKVDDIKAASGGRPMAGSGGAKVEDRKTAGGRPVVANGGAKSDGTKAAGGRPMSGSNGPKAEDTNAAEECVVTAGSGGAKPEDTKAAAEPPVVAASGGANNAPTSMRMRREGGANTTRPTRSDWSIRVNNLSDDARDADLQYLFHKFNYTRVHAVMDQNTNVCKGFGFVNFWYRENAQRAINNMDGYGYDHRLLRVEWAAPRQPRQ